MKELGIAVYWEALYQYFSSRGVQSKRRPFFEAMRLGCALDPSLNDGLTILRGEVIIPGQVIGWSTPRGNTRVTY
jgi:hypothetical protein